MVPPLLPFVACRGSCELVVDTDSGQRTATAIGNNRGLDLVRCCSRVVATETAAVKSGSVVAEAKVRHRLSILLDFGRFSARLGLPSYRNNNSNNNNNDDDECGGSGSSGKTSFAANVALSATHSVATIKIPTSPQISRGRQADRQAG